MKHIELFYDSVESQGQLATTNEQKVEVLLQEGEALLADDRPQEAIPKLREAILASANPPARATVLLRKARTACLSKETARCVDLFNDRMYLS